MKTYEVRFHRIEHYITEGTVEADSLEEAHDKVETMLTSGEVSFEGSPESADESVLAVVEAKDVKIE